jgi:hypothetical protein
LRLIVGEPLSHDALALPLLPGEILQHVRSTAAQGAGREVLHSLQDDFGASALSRRDGAA